MIYLDGRFMREEEATIPISDRGFLFGDGLFTTLKVEGGRALWFADHLRKLHEQAERFHILLPSLHESTLDELIERNGMMEGKVKIIVTGGDSKELGLPKRKGRLLMIPGPLPQYPKILTLRVYSAPLFPGKMLSYLPRLFLAEQAKPCDDCLLLNSRGEILETAFGNLFWIIDGEIFTPNPTCLPIYFGVAMERMAAEKRVHFVSATLEDLPPSAELYRVNALASCRASVSPSLVDGGSLDRVAV